ncbi:MAG: hypothetical protein ACFFDH_09000 [Promethearchaeota archaeon]
MLFSIIEEGISEITQLFLRGKLKNWWDYHKINRHIARLIKDTCEDEQYNFDDFLIRLGTTEALIKDRLKKLKKSFRETKSFTGTEAFIENIVENYLDIFLKVEDTISRKNPLKSDEMDLIKKIKHNIQVYLSNFKPVDMIANININLKKIEIQNSEYYESLIEELNKLSEQTELIPDNLVSMANKINDVLNTLQNDHKIILKKISEISSGQKVTDTVSFNELIDVKIGFSGVNFKEKSIGVEDQYTIKIVVDSKILFQVLKIIINREPVNAVIGGKEVKYDSLQDGNYIFNLPLAINCGVGTNLVAIINIKGPKPNFRYELYVSLEGEVKEEEITYPVKKSKGPIVIERGSELEVLGNVALGIVDTLFDTKLSDTLKKIKDKAEEERYF